MQKVENSNTFDQESEERTVNIGTLLVNARNHASLSQADVADQINLSLSTIKALESDNFENLPGSTYIRGYLRNYARVVGIDVNDVLDAYDACNDQHQVESTISLHSNLNPSYDTSILWSTAAVVTILIGLLVTWWVDLRQTPKQSIEYVSNDSAAIFANKEIQAVAQKTNTVIEHDDNIEMHPFEEAANQIPSTEQGHTTNPSFTEPLDANVEQAMQNESQNPNLVTLNNDSDVLTVTFVDKSWTEIKDADLNPLMQGLIEPGVVKNLNGKAPFHIFLGNSPGVVIEVNGQYFDQSEYNRSNRTARFQISGSSFN